MFYRGHRRRPLCGEGQFVLANGMPQDWQGWAAVVGRALLSGPALPPDELLLVRDLQGRVLRPLAPPPGTTPRAGAVLILLYPDGNDLRLPLTVRSDRLAHHRGEVSLPGGASELSDADPPATALRECGEELGVDTAAIAVWGTLSSIYIGPSNFQIVPVVGFVQALPTLTPNSAEVGRVITVTLGELLDPATVVIEQWTLRGHEVQVPFFAVAGYKVWGATAFILSELAARIRHALTGPAGSTAAG
jgi:8-oxo-dGTP pyrophosphatase MutT (NUDIX family)